MAIKFELDITRNNVELNVEAGKSAMKHSSCVRGAAGTVLHLTVYAKF
jgi:hypothetical protein